MRLDLLSTFLLQVQFDQAGSTSKMKWRLEHGFSLNKRSLLFLTTGNQRKGYPFLLQLMDRLLDEPIELIVTGVKPMPTDLPNVRYVGYSEHSEELLWAADALIHPALYEPFGQVITEAIQCGTPVIVSEMVDAKQIVDRQVGKIVSGFTLDAWRHAVLDTLNRHYDIPADFAQTHGLTTEQHCQKIIELSATPI